MATPVQNINAFPFIRDIFVWGGGAEWVQINGSLWRASFWPNPSQYYLHSLGGAQTRGYYAWDPGWCQSSSVRSTSVAVLHPSTFPWRKLIQINFTMVPQTATGSSRGLRASKRVWKNSTFLVYTFCSCKILKHLSRFPVCVAIQYVNNYYSFEKKVWGKVNKKCNTQRPFYDLINPVVVWKS